MADPVKTGRYLKARVGGLDKTKAAKKSGISRRTACRIEKSPEFRSAMVEALEKAGVTETRLAEKISALLDAHKCVSIVSGRDANAGTVDFEDVPDNAVQLKAVELAGKFRGDFLERVEHSGEIGVIDFSERLTAAKKRAEAAIARRSAKKS